MSVRRVSRPLSEKESLLLSTLSGAGETVFTIEDARDVLGDSEVDVRKLLHRLNRKLRRIAGRFDLGVGVVPTE